jgi:hypothetical protein
MWSVNIQRLFCAGICAITLQLLSISIIAKPSKSSSSSDSTSSAASSLYSDEFAAPLAAAAQQPETIYGKIGVSVSVQMLD